jgi:Ser/Thr protein kinase RdoA (MazF antagonist)
VNPLDIIAAPNPNVPEDHVLELLADEFGLSGRLETLVSERDQNFRLSPPGGTPLVVKIANAEEPAEITDFQLQALLHLQERECPVEVPRITTTRTGALCTTIRNAGVSHVLRVVSYVPGTPVEGTQPGPDLAYELGRSLAQLDAALTDFSHPGESQVLLWDMQRAGDLQELVQHVPEAASLRDLVIECLKQFESNAQPAFADLRRQVIHNDLNPGNVLIDDRKPPGVSGVIDFGDMLRAPLIVDVAIAASYLRTIDEELTATTALVAGFDSITPLVEAEKAILFDLIRTRLAATITIMYWRMSARSSDDPYLKKAFAERSSEHFLRHISALGQKHFSERVLRAEN